MNWKRLKNLLGMTWFTLFFFFGSFLFYSDATIDTDKLQEYKGQITDLGITTHRSSTSSGPRTSKVFFIQLEGLAEKLATYNTNQTYGELQNSLRTGDIVYVTFKPSSKTDQPNIDLYELKLGNKVLVEQSTYRTKRLIASLIALLGAIITLFIGLRKDRRHWKGRHITVASTNAPECFLQLSSDLHRSATHSESFFFPSNCFASGVFLANCSLS
ncbi:MAG: hypothetical protein ABJN36_01255 [Cyclobacteriaceae bacterium]